jgi:hypothetical protein
MSPTDFKRWRERLRHARDVWVDKGLIGTSRPSMLRLLLEFYRGNQWAHLGQLWGLTEQEMVTANKIFSTANTIQAQLSTRNPKTLVRARNPRGLLSAPNVQALLDYDIEEQDHMRQWNLALRDHLFAPVGVTRHGFTPQEEFFDKDGKRLQNYRPARPDRPWIQTLPIWDVLLNPLARSFHNDGGLEWCAFRGLKTVSQIDRTPGMIKRDGLVPTIGHPFKEMRPKELRDEQNEDWNDLVEFYTVYEIEERTWFQITLDQLEKPLRDPDDWPIQWEHLPIDILAVNEQMDTPFPIPIMEEVVPIQVEMNILRTIMRKVVKNTRRIIGAQEGAIDDEELDKLEMGETVEILRTKGPANQALQEIKSGGFPQELLAYEALLDKDLRETAGVSLMDNAQRINVETAEEAARVGQGSSIHTLRNQTPFEKYMQSSIRNYMQARRQTMTEEELVPILGQEGAAEGREPFLTVSPEDLANDYDYRVRVGSTLPDSRERDAQQALADINVAGTAPDLHNLEQEPTRTTGWRGARTRPST